MRSLHSSDWAFLCSRTETQWKIASQLPKMLPCTFAKGCCLVGFSCLAVAMLLFAKDGYSMLWAFPNLVDDKFIKCAIPLSLQHLKSKCMHAVFCSQLPVMTNQSPLSPMREKLFTEEGHGATWKSLGASYWRVDSATASWSTHTVVGKMRSNTDFWCCRFTILLFQERATSGCDQALRCTRKVNMFLGMDFF